ncbi:hypothetical protein KIN20_018767 [Parelaphostrongylus tenuis]|uniref:Uncharacterized protein n=1 Tax=Parelaphostrongylus tenuis TaxID=148309 RepID=A0AAD5QPU7_PARTN|nr:hypothetical protein KIN20_018767 [Parelaphostrongylus tenuis]
MIDTPGTYDLEEIEKTTGKSNVVKLPAVQGTTAYIIQLVFSLALFRNADNDMISVESYNWEEAVVYVTKSIVDEVITPLLVLDSAAAGFP